MTRITIALQRLDCESPVVKILQKDELDTMLAPSRQMQRARTRAARILWSARAQRARMKVEAQARVQQTLAEAGPEIDRRAELARQEAVEQAVQWLVNEAGLEDEVVSRIEHNVRELVISSVGQLISDQVRLGLLVEQLAAELRHASDHGDSLVRVHPARLEDVRTALGEVGTVSCVSDDALTEDQAVLETRFVRVTVDIGSQLDSVLALLRNGQQGRLDAYGEPLP